MLSAKKLEASKAMQFPGKTVGHFAKNYGKLHKQAGIFTWKENS